MKVETLEQLWFCEDGSDSMLCCEFCDAWK